VEVFLEEDASLFHVSDEHFKLFVYFSLSGFFQFAEDGIPLFGLCDGLSEFGKLDR
jgi:hypothetical protein